VKQAIRTAAACAVLALVAGLAGCQKATEAVTEKAMEKSMEAQMKKDGATEAKVDLSSGTIKSVTVDKDGTKKEFEMGNASAVSEADLGLPFYPGAKIDNSHVIRVVNNNEMGMMVPLETTDSAEKAAAFYRERLKAMSAGRQFMDMAEGNNTTLMLVNESKSEVIQVMVSAGKNGEPATSIVLNVSRKKPA